MTDGAANSPKTGTGRHELPTELETPLPAALYLNLKSVRRRICGHGAQRGANRTPSASLSAAAPPSNSGRGFQRGGTAVPPLCATRGYGGKRAKRRRGRIKRGAFEEMARLAAHQGWESCCRNGAFGLLPRPLGVGFQRRGPRPPAFVSLGVQGEVETPWCFSSRGVGRVLFQKRMRPTSLRWELSLAGAENYVKAGGRAPRVRGLRKKYRGPGQMKPLG